jgi:hypothetical protein
MRLSPKLHPFDIVGATEVIVILGFLQPAALAVGFAGLLARGLGAIALAAHIAIVGHKEPSTMPTLALSDGTIHRPRSPRDHDRRVANQKEEDKGPKPKGEEEKNPGRKGSIERVGKKTKLG